MPPRKRGWGRVTCPEGIGTDHGMRPAHFGLGSTSPHPSLQRRGRKKPPLPTVGEGWGEGKFVNELPNTDIFS